MLRAETVTSWFIDSSRSMSTLMTRSHSVNTDVACIVSIACAPAWSPARARSMTFSARGRAFSCTALMSARAFFSSAVTAVPSAKISSIGASDAA